MFDTLSIDLQDRWRGYQQRYRNLYNPLFLEAFGERYEGHELFAWHAAFPGIVTPDLLYQIWFNFRLYPSQTPLVGEGSSRKKRIFAFPNFLVSDFLQSSLCEEVGHHQYAINRELRAYFLEKLKADERFGEERILGLATLLEQYRKQKPKISEQSGLGEYHRWVARASLNPQAMAKEFGDHLKTLVEQLGEDRSKLVEIRKMKRLLKDLSRTDEAFSDLAEYSEVMDDYLVGKKARGGQKAILSNVPQGPGAVALPFYTELKEELGLGEKEYVRQYFEKGKNKVYALVVGINTYADPSITPLAGAVKDVLAIESYLKETFEPDVLELKTLIDEQATQKKIVRGFLDHLGTAGPGDVALFFFAGQGSQEEADEIFWELEPDKKLETILAYDSRTINSPHDLTYRELSALIYLLDKRKPNILLVIDACHSGKDHEEFLTVEAAEEAEDYDLPEQQAYGNEQAEEDFGDDFFQQSRAIQDAGRPRPPSDFLFNQMEEFGDEFSQLFERNERLTTFPEGSHVYFSSGMSHEKAYEQTIDGESRGVFSYEFLEVLKGLTHPVSNAQVLLRIQERVRQRQTEQTPQLYVSGESKSGDLFLFGALEYKRTDLNSAFLQEIARILSESSLKIKGILSRKIIPDEELLEAVIEQYPSPTSFLLKTLLHTAEQEKSTRLSLAKQVSQSLMQLTVHLLLTELANTYLRQTELVKSVELTEQIEAFFHHTRPRHEGFDMHGLMLEIIQFLDETESETILPDWRSFRDSMDSEWEEAYRFFHGEEDREILVDNAFIDKQLLVLLTRFVYLTRYDMLSVKDVQLQSPPHRTADYLVECMYLRKIDGLENRPAESFEMDQLLDNQSVLLLNGKNEALNLNPLLLDKRTLNGFDGADLYVFSHQERRSGEYVYHQGIDPSGSKELRVSSDTYPEIHELMERLKQLLLEGKGSHFQRISALVNKGLLEEAINLLEMIAEDGGMTQLFDEASKLSKQYDDLLDLRKKGLKNSEDDEREVKRISDMILTLAKQLKTS
ncbi:MAG: caspase family protein [Bacteroidota bacterium]